MSRFGYRGVFLVLSAVLGVPVLACRLAGEAFACGQGAFVAKAIVLAWKGYKLQKRWQ